MKQPSESADMSNRLSILIALNKHGNLTYDELEQNTGIARDKLRIATNDAKKASHLVIGKDKDPVTGQQVFVITALGEQWILNNTPKTTCTESQTEQSVKQTMLTEQAVKRSMSTDKACCNAAKVVATTAGADVSFLNDQIEKLTIECDGMREVLKNIRKTMGIDITQSIKFEIERRSVEFAWRLKEKNDELAQANAANNNWLALAKEFGCDDIPGLRIFLKFQDRELVEAKRQTNDALAKLDAEEQRSFSGELKSILPAGYIVITPNKPIRRFKKSVTATTQALATVRGGGQAEVFSIYSEGKAVRDVAWKSRSEPVQQ